MSANQAVGDTEEDLRKCMRDLVALSALSAAWSECQPVRIARNLADILREMLSVDFIYVRLWNQGNTAIEIASNSKDQDVLAETARIGMEFDPTLRSGVSLNAIQNPLLGNGVVYLASAPIGRAASSGAIVAGCRRPGFPTEAERLLLTVAANQAGIVIGNEQNTQQAKADRRRWRELLLKAPAAIAFLRGPDHVFDLVNAEYVRATGRSETALMGKPVREALPEAAGQGLFELLDEVYQTRAPSIGSEVLVKLDRRGDGTLEGRYFDVVYQPSEDSNGQMEGILAHAVDVTEKVMARQRLEQSERQFSTLADSMDQLAWMAQPDGDIFWYNQRWYEYTGATPEQMRGWGWQSVHDPQILPTVLARWQGSLRSGEAFEMEFPLRGGDGLFHWFLTRVIPLRDAEGRIIRWFGTNTDITELKRVRDERGAILHREREIRATAELLNLVGPTLVSQLESSKLVQSVIDLATTLAGAEFGSFFHCVVEEDGNSSMLQALSGVSPEAFARFSLPRATEVLEQAFQGERAFRSEDITKDPRYETGSPQGGVPEGYWPVKSYMAVPVISRSGEVLGGLFFGHSAPGSFTERHEAIVTGIAARAAIAMDNARLFERAQRAQQELQQSNRELVRVNKDLETFAYSASHDLQEPLRNVSIYSQLLRQRHGSRLEGEAAMFLQGILDGTTRMEMLAEALLAYSHATKSMTGPLPITDSHGVLDGVLRSLKARIDENAAIVTAGELPPIPIQEVHLSQLFQNLISNSLKYRNREVPRVHISATQQSDHWLFSIADNGIGVDPKYRAQIFGLFKRLHSREAYPGSGVGLAICQRIVEQYGGRIWVEPALGGGSVFFFTIPRFR